MTESTKTLNSSVSTIKKNRSRVDRLIKAAKLLIVPPKQYATGKAREIAEAAVAKLKAKRGLNGVVGEGAGPFSDKALQKHASEQKGKDAAIAAGTTASGAALGAGLSHDRAKSVLNGRRAVKNNYSVSKNVHGAEKRLSQSAKVSRRMAKPLRRIAMKGGLAGAAIGAGLGAANMMNKEAAVSKGKEVVAVGKSRNLANLAKLKKAGKIGAAVAAGAAAVGAGVHAMKKQASVVGTLTRSRRAAKAFAQMKTDDARKKALVSAAKKTGLVGGVAGAGYVVTKKNEQLKKQAATLVVKDGKKYRKGTVASAATTMGTVNGVLRTMAAGPKGAARAALKGAANGALLGGAYGTVRGANRLRKGEISLTDREMKQLTKRKLTKKASELLAQGNGLGKQAAELIIRDGKKYRKGTVGSAATKMAVTQASIGALANYVGARMMKRMTGLPVSARQILTKNLKTNLAVGGAWGAGYGAVRGHLRNNRGEHSVSPGQFERMKAGY